MKTLEIKSMSQFKQVSAELKELIKKSTKTPQTNADYLRMIELQRAEDVFCSGMEYILGL